MLCAMRGRYYPAVAIVTNQPGEVALFKMAKMTAKKLAKMSEEDRATYLEQQRLEEEESQRKKEEMLNRFLKDKLNKEEQSTQLNLLKLREQWRNIMRKSKTIFVFVQLLCCVFIGKLVELKKDCEVMKETFERVVDRKDALIKSLAKDLEEANEQYPKLLSVYVERDIEGEKAKVP